jgi:hypothetical protein
MTADQLLVALFQTHWIFTTFALPGVTFVYAVVTESYAWAFWSAALFIAIRTLLGAAKK